MMVADDDNEFHMEINFNPSIVWPFIGFVGTAVSLGGQMTVQQRERIMPSTSGAGGRNGVQSSAHQDINK